jgi:signal transduction histidine kinase
MVLHNLFFLVLTCAAYFSLIPQFERQVADARAREISILEHAHANGAPQQTLVDLSLSEQSYTVAVWRARVALFLVLGIIYTLAVLLLEVVIMPRYVYEPIERMLAADAATQAGDHQRELIPSEIILGDEIGQIMRSRNDTVATLRKREDELAGALRRLEEQDRLVSLGLLSASVAHELNTPLAVLNGSIEKLIETTRDPHTLERLERMQRVAERLRTISESLVGFSKLRQQDTGPETLRPLIDEAWSLVAIHEKASAVTYTNHIAAEERVTANAGRLIQVFVNVLRNAVHAVPAQGGTIDVHAHAAVRNGAPGVAITVEDNGAGIAAEVLPDIFDAFVTTRLDARGTGLGLTVAEGIVTQHGGVISATNRAEGGARLEVWLPEARVSSPDEPLPQPLVPHPPA